MESPGSDSVNCGVGSIVWVRRRNGSWWPGKILGTDELSSSHLTSPRSGTPVKLLGREDASVDWYNLEKSKRVKAFRCGEFDDCIERAESSQGMPIKKREKYARREDAILHALELEKQMFKQQGKLSLPVCRTDNKSNGGMRKGLHPSSEHLKNDNVKVGNSKLRHLSKRLDAIEGTEMDVSHASPKMKEAILFSGEDDLSVEPRMRGLQDFGLKISSTKRKLSTSAASDCSKKVENDNNAPSHSLVGHGMGSDANGDEQMRAVCRAKRTKCMYLPESSDSLEYKENIPSQIEMSASQFGTGSSHSYPGSLIEENVSDFSGDGGSDSSGSDSSDSETDSDSSRTVRDVDNEMEIFSDGVVHTEMQPNTFGRSEVPEHTSMSEGEPDNSGISGDMYDLDPIYPGYANESVSKWKLKGKRNSRNLAKRSADGANPRLRLGPKASGKSPGFNRNYYFNDTSAETNMGVDDFKSRIKLEDGYYLTPRSVTKAGNAISCNVMDWDDMTCHDRSSLQGYWDTKREPCGLLYDPPHLFGGRSRSIWVEVDLTVQASYRKEPVPIVSLMSKLNGRAIIGHPIQIETLEDGSTDTISYAPVDSDRSTKLPPAWRTARRTANSRVPRPHLSSTHDGHEAVYDYSLMGGGESKLLFKKSFSNHRASLGRSIQRVSQLPDDWKLLKKTKKVSLSSSQKTRTLSSIAVGQNISSKPIHSSNSSLVDGLIKQESSSGPATATVSCIPVKLVFSRLMEKINRPASKASTYMPLLNNNSDKNPL